MYKSTQVSIPNRLFEHGVRGPKACTQRLFKHGVRGPKACTQRLVEHGVRGPKACTQRLERFYVPGLTHFGNLGSQAHHSFHNRPISSGLNSLASFCGIQGNIMYFEYAFIIYFIWSIHTFHGNIITRMFHIYIYIHLLHNTVM